MLAGGCDRQSATSKQPGPAAVSAGSLPTGTASAPAAAEPAGTVDRSHKGEPLPDVTVADPTGAKLALTSLKGKPVLVNLWATWCAPCVAELPTLDKLAAKGTVRVLTISQDQQTARVPQFLHDKGGAHLPAWIDAKADLSFHYGGATLPTTILYDAAGREVWRFGGGQDWTGPNAAKLLAEAG